MNKPSPAPLDIKFARIKAVNFALRPAPRQESLEALKKRLGPAPGVYSAEPAVLDFSAWNDADFSTNEVGLEAYAQVLREAGVHLVEVRGHSEALESQAEALGYGMKPARKISVALIQQVKCRLFLTTGHRQPPTRRLLIPELLSLRQAQPRACRRVTLPYLNLIPTGVPW